MRRSDIAAEAVEEPGLQAQAFERIGLQKAAKGEFEKAREITSTMKHPDGVLVGMAVKQNSMGLEDDAVKTIDEIEHAGAAVAPRRRHLFFPQVVVLEVVDV